MFTIGRRALRVPSNRLLLGRQSVPWRPAGCVATRRFCSDASTDVQARIAHLEKLKADAASDEDFAKAAELKTAIDRLKSGLSEDPGKPMPSEMQVIFRAKPMEGIVEQKIARMMALALASSGAVSVIGILVGPFLSPLFLAVTCAGLIGQAGFVVNRAPPMLHFHILPRFITGLIVKGDWKNSDGTLAERLEIEATSPTATRQLVLTKGGKSDDWNFGELFENNILFMPVEEAEVNNEGLVELLLAGRYQVIDEKIEYKDLDAKKPTSGPAAALWDPKLRLVGLNDEKLKAISTVRKEISPAMMLHRIDKAGLVLGSGAGVVLLVAAFKTHADYTKEMEEIQRRRGTNQAAAA